MSHRVSREGEPSALGRRRDPRDRRARDQTNAMHSRQEDFDRLGWNKSMNASRLDRRLLIFGLTALFAVVAVTPGQAQDGGKYGNLTARWWQWVYAQPAVDTGGTNTNPVLDTTGAHATAGQEHGIGPGNKFFFLPGTFGGDVTRTVTVPRGKALFFPLLNIETDNAVDPPTNNKVPKLKALAKASIDVATSLYATLDGHDLEIF